MSDLLVMVASVIVEVVLIVEVVDETIGTGVTVDVSVTESGVYVDT